MPSLFSSPAAAGEEAAGLCGPPEGVAIFSSPVGTGEAARQGRRGKPSSPPPWGRGRRPVRAGEGSHLLLPRGDGGGGPSGPEREAEHADLRRALTSPPPGPLPLEREGEQSAPLPAAAGGNRALGEGAGMSLGRGAEARSRGVCAPPTGGARGAQGGQHAAWAAAPRPSQSGGVSGDSRSWPAGARSDGRTWRGRSGAAVV